jgi:hypothetical protein
MQALLGFVAMLLHAVLKENTFELNFGIVHADNGNRPGVVLRLAVVLELTILQMHLVVCC